MSPAPGWALQCICFGIYTHTTVLAVGDRPHTPIIKWCNTLSKLSKILILAIRAISLNTTVKVLFQVASLYPGAGCTNSTGHQLVKPLFQVLAYFSARYAAIAAWCLNMRGEHLQGPVTIHAI